MNNLAKYLYDKINTDNYRVIQYCHNNKIIVPKQQILAFLYLAANNKEKLSRIYGGYLTDSFGKFYIEKVDK